MTKKIEASAIDVLKQISAKPMWYGDAFNKDLAARYKARAMSGKLTADKAAEILGKLGWQKVKSETWAKKQQSP